MSVTSTSAPGEEAEHRLAALVGGEVGGDPALVGVEVEEDAAALGVGLAAGEWSGAAGAVALGRLDLDDVGSKVGEELAAVRAGHPLGKLDYAEIVQRGLRHRSLPPCLLPPVIEDAIACGGWTALHARRLDDDRVANELLELLGLEADEVREHLAVVLAEHRRRTVVELRLAVAQRDAG